MASNGDDVSRLGYGEEPELASSLSPGAREAQFLEAAVSEVSRTTSASSMSDKSAEEDATWWASSDNNSSDPASLSSCSSSKRSDDWSFRDFDLLKSKLTIGDTWWAPIAADTMRLAEDLAQGGCPIPASWRVANFDPRKTWKRFRRYRYFLLFVTAVTVINGFLSILLLECLLGTSTVCMFGSCQSPQYVPASSFAYDRSTLNPSTTPSPMPSSTSATQSAPAFTDADDEAFLNEVSLEWDVNPHPSVPRAYTLKKKQGQYQALLAQDVCYLFMQGTGPEHGKATGVWFDADAIDAVRGGDTRGILDARDLQKLDLINLLVDSGEDGEDTVHKGAFRYTPDFFRAQKRVNRTVGSFVGPRGLSEYIRLSSNTATRHLMRSRDLQSSLVGLVGGIESNIASFSSNSVFLSEVVSPSASLLKQSVVFFPGDREIFSQWTEGALKASVGSQSSAVAGQKQGQPFCFRNVMFLLNERPAAAVEIDNFRQKAWTIADSAVSFFKRNEQLLSLEPVQKVVATAGREVRLQLGLSADIAQTAQRLKQVAADARKVQITVLVDSVRDGKVESSKIANIDAVLALLKRMFPKMVVVPFSLAESSFVEQAAIFKRTVLLITPYGMAAGSTILLPRGSSVLEIFPFMFQSEATMSIARSAGVSYFKWENDDAANSKYEGDCLTKNAFQSLTASECRRHRPCLFCVRDHVSTSVNRKELRGVLGKAQVAVRSFLAANRKSGGWSSLR